MQFGLILSTNYSLVFSVCVCVCISHDIISQASQKT